MIYFIGQENDFDELRKEIFENTVSILNLFEERVSLSKKISKIKQENSLEIRDSLRELEVMKRIGITNSYTTGILRFLFEFSIDFQMEREINLPWEDYFTNGISYKKIFGNKAIIELLSGIFLGRFGKIIWVQSPLPKNLEIGFALRGSHITDSEPDGKYLELNIGECFHGGIANLISSGEEGLFFIPASYLRHYESMNLKVFI